MVNWTLFMVLILPAMVRLHREGIREETIRRERGVVSVCRNDTNIITLIVCEIRTERRREQNCTLLFLRGQEFEDECDSRFRLVKKSETVFIQWKDLTPEDHGKITCECSRMDRTFTLQLSIQLEDTLWDAGQKFPTRVVILIIVVFLAGSTLIIFITAVIMGLRWIMNRHGVSSRSAAPGSEQETFRPLGRDGREDPYSSLQLPTSDLYQTIAPVHRQSKTRRSQTQTIKQM